MTYSGAALFALGLSIKATLKAGQSVLITALVAVKVLLLPLVMALTTHLMTGDQTDSEFAFLYGMLPTAPTVYIFAVNYRLKESLMSSSCLVCLIASLPMIVIAGIALQMRSEKDIKAENGIGLTSATWAASISVGACILMLIFAFLARERRTVKGCWRLYICLTIVTIMVSASKLGCLSCDGDDLSEHQAVILRVFMQWCAFLQRSYGVVLAVTLFSRLQGQPAFVLTVERYGHAAVWIFSTVLAVLHGSIPMLQPKYFSVGEGEIGYQTSIMACTTEEQLPYQLLELVITTTLAVVSLVMVSRFQVEIKRQCHEDYGPINSDDEGSMMLQTEGGSLCVDNKRRPLLNPAEGKDAQISVVNSPTHSDWPTPSCKNDEEIEEACRDSTRYTLLIMYNTAGLTLWSIMLISRLLDMNKTARGFTQILHVLDVMLHLSTGIFLLLVFVTHLDIQWGILVAYNRFTECCPCFERFRSWVAGEFYFPDEVQSPTMQFHGYRKPSMEKFRKASERRRSSSCSSRGWRENQNDFPRSLPTENVMEPKSNPLSSKDVADTFEPALRHRSVPLSKAMIIRDPFGSKKVGNLL
mmetsp:Transcript_7239/g.14207  ORF Transcript_7239/g.14207 Transcript_7239/m.14207 type:complete len:584 (-) Transcript_7239:256-2007(-)